MARSPSRRLERPTEPYPDIGPSEHVAHEPGALARARSSPVARATGLARALDATEPGNH